MITYAFLTSPESTEPVFMPTLDAARVYVRAVGKPFHETALVGEMYFQGNRHTITQLCNGNFKPLRCRKAWGVTKRGALVRRYHESVTF